MGSHRAEDADTRWRHRFGVAPALSVWEWLLDHHKRTTVVLVAIQAAVAVGFKLVSDLWWIIGLGALTLIVAVLIGIVSNAKVMHVEEERLEASIETRVAITDSLSPTMVQLGRMLDGAVAHRRNELSGLTMTVLAGSVGLAPSESRPRACYFRMNEARDRMACSQFAGRSGEPRGDFIAGTAAGDAALEMVRANEKLFCDDVNENPPEGWIAAERGKYRTFIAVPVRCSKTLYGMLTLDALAVGSLTEEDAEMLRILGAVLGIAEHEAPPAQPLRARI